MLEHPTSVLPMITPSVATDACSYWGIGNDITNEVKMTVKELKKLLAKIPDNYIVWDFSCVREINKDDIVISHEEKVIGYAN